MQISDAELNLIREALQLLQTLVTDAPTQIMIRALLLLLDSRQQDAESHD